MLSKNLPTPFKKEEIERSIVDRFELIASTYANRLAIKGGEQTMTYAALNRSANQLAHTILRWGAAANGPIALLLDHAPPLIMALMGVLKTGRAYLALDPTHPPARLAHILADAQVSGLITNHRHLSLAKTLGSGQCKLLNLDDLSGDEPADNPELLISGETIAGLFYTSGSTGRPKGVIRTHSFLLQRSWLESNEDYITPDDKISLLYSCSFGASVADIFNPLLTGATLCMYDLRKLGLTQLAAWLTQEHISFLHLPVALFRQFLDNLTGAEDFSKIRQVVPSGRLYRHDVERFREHFPPETILVSRMSSTETGIIARLLIDRQTVIAGEVVPVGYPVAGKAVYLLDENGRAVGPGQMGEIVVQSRYLSLGYWRRPELTQAAFSSVPANEGVRTYRMGDFGRRRADGCLEFLGRRDDQVKVRGYRVELSEVEAALYNLDMVKEATVVSHKGPTDEQYLTAYVVPQSGEITPSTLRQALGRALPAYMVPAHFIYLEKLPLLPNGKIDYQTLPQPEQLRPALATPYLPPRTPTEEALANIWLEVLGLDKVGVHDSFLDLGGHSLLATQIAARVFHSFHVDLSPQMLLEAATVAQMAAAIEQQHLKPQNGSQATPALTPRSDPSEPAPLSFGQQRLWFIQQFAPEMATYNMPKLLRLEGPLNVTALRQALDALVARQAALRTTIDLIDDEPRQLIAVGGSLLLPLIDLSLLSPGEREAKWTQLRAEEMARPFDLTNDWPIRTMLYKFADDSHLLLLVTHHIATDHQSTTILLRELGQLYSAITAGNPSPLPELPLQYADFAVWQRQWLQGEVQEQHLSYWQQQLGGELPILNLPTDYPRPAMQTDHGERQAFVIPQQITQALKNLSQQEQTTLFTTLLAAFNTLLYRYTGQEDIIIGTPVSTRPQVATERLVGFLVNTLALRADLSGSPSFRELLGRVRQVTQGAYTHQTLPFEQVVEMLQPDRDLSRSPIFQVMFNFVTLPETTFNFAGLTTTRLDIHHQRSLFDLSLTLKEQAGHLAGQVEYNTDLFEAATMTRLMGHFQTLLQGIITHPDAPISQLPLLTEAERRQILVEWNETAADYPDDVCIHHLFEAQTQQHPDALAATAGDRQISYAVLNRRANQLAHHLQTLGVGPDVIVGLYLERSIDLIVGQLAIFKAGGAYLPLDPANPPDRLAFMLVDAQAPILLTQSSLAKNVSVQTTHLICLDTDWPLIEQENEDNPSSQTTASHLAYVIYTSGSTGTPKGVQLEHRGLVNLVCWHQQTFKVTAADRATQLAGLSFDAAVWEMWPYLTAGASLHFPPDEETRLSPERLRDWLVAQQISLTFVPTPLAEKLMRLEWPSQVELRAVLTGGDKLHDYPPPDLPFELINNYGPTEYTVVTTSTTVSTASQSNQAPAIGHPIANTQVYILDKQLQPVPVGVPGEIHIGGRGVARGYLNRPKLTAEKFINNPFGQSRLYKSGDLARYRPDGNIEFLGRMDNQVKIRGYRIELGEIETVLSQHPAVENCVVIVHENGAGNKQLVAYVAREQSTNNQWLTTELRHYLKEKLPDYMLPSFFVTLNQFPLNASGKVDRAALPAPDVARPDLAEVFVAPEGPVEEMLAEVWQETLGIEQVGVHDNFFELGGHSLLAIRIVSRLLQDYEVELPLRRLFEYPTIAELASVIEEILLAEMQA